MALPMLRKPLAIFASRSVPFYTEHKMNLDESFLGDDSRMIQSLISQPNTFSYDAMRQELKTIQQQRAEAEQQLQSLKERVASTEAWIRDLAVTERTMAKLLDIELPETAPPPAKPRGRKPPATPSIFRMACDAIRDSGEEWLEASEILGYIQRRHWREATANDVSPTLWRLAMKDQRLRKDGTRYALPLPKQENTNQTKTGTAVSSMPANGSGAGLAAQ